MALNDNTLGRSIKDVFERTARREPSKGYLEVDIGLVVPSKANPRQHFDEADLASLTDSVKTHGILQPLVVLRQGVGFEILAGHRRYLAAKAAGLARVPVVIRDDTDPQHVAEMRLVENIQRADLNPIELAEAYQRLIESHGLTHDDLASRVNKDRSSITNALRLLGLPERLRDEVVAGRLSAGHAKILAGIADPAWQAELGARIIRDGLSVRVAENLARLGPQQATPVQPAPKSSAVKELETNLTLLLNSKVTVKERKGGRGSMTIHFGDRNQLNRIMLILTKVMNQPQGPNGSL